MLVPRDAARNRPLRVRRRGRRAARRRRPKRRRRWIVHVIVWPLLALRHHRRRIRRLVRSTPTPMSVRADLEDARVGPRDFQSVAADRRLADLPAIADRLAASAQQAVEPTAAAALAHRRDGPGVGENFRAVRIIAEGVDDVSTEVVTPASTLLGTFGLAARPGHGRLRPRAAARGDRDRDDGRAGRQRPARAGAVDRHGCHDRPGRRRGRPVRRDAHQGRRTPSRRSTARSRASARCSASTARRTSCSRSSTTPRRPRSVADPPRRPCFASTTARSTSCSRSRATTSRSGSPWTCPSTTARCSCTTSIFLDNLNAATSRPDFPTAASIISANWQRTWASRPTSSCPSIRSRCRGCCR